MKREINNCLRLGQLLLLLFVFNFLNCSVLKNGNDKGLQNLEAVLQVAVYENDFLDFYQRIHELELIAVDLRPAITNVSFGDKNVYWFTFRFVGKHDFLRGYSEIMSTGLVKQIN